METQSRTIAKTISWRVFATLITSTIVWLVTGKAELGLSIAVFDCAIKLVTYYIHERVWNHVGFGYQPQPQIQPVHIDQADSCRAVTH